MLTSELRWILAAICVPLLAGIWWWSARRSRQAPGNSQLRETSTSGAQASAAVHAPVSPSPYPGEPGEPPEDVENFAPAVAAQDDAPSEWGVPPFEPLSIRTADFDEVQVLESPMMADPEPLDESEEIAMATQLEDHVTPQSEPHPAVRGAEEFEPPPRETAFRFPSEPTRAEASWPPAAPPQAAAPLPTQRPAPVARPAASTGETGPTGSRSEAPNNAETQRIVMVRVCAAGDSRWSGIDLLTALDDYGLAHGRYQVFHRKHSDGRTLFCAASLVEPGTFDLAQMPREHYRGLTLFAVLPGPADALQTVDALIDTAQGLAQSLRGTVQDSKGRPLSPERAEALREDVARFHASSSG